MAKITKSADSLRFEHAPFYNLANVRKDAVSLITRASADPKKVEAIAETLEVLSAFLKVRSAHAAKVRKADVAAAAAAEEQRKAHDEASRVASAKHRADAAARELAEAEAVLAEAGVLKDAE